MYQQKLFCSGGPQFSKPRKYLESTIDTLLQRPQLCSEGSQFFNARPVRGSGLKDCYILHFLQREMTDVSFFKPKPISELDLINV